MEGHKGDGAEMNTRKKKLIALGIASIMIIALILLLSPTGEEKESKLPSTELPEQYMVLVDEPFIEEERTFTACLSSIAVRDKYNPFFILDDGSLDSHQLSTINNLTIKDVPKLLFTFNEDTISNVESQIGNVTVYEPTPETLMDFKGYDGIITVGSYEEAIWASPLARVENKILIPGEPTFNDQSEVWDELSKHEINANYVVVTNPEDYVDVDYYADERYDGASFHIPKLSLVSAELAAYHNAYVLTNITPSTEEIGHMDTDLNAKAIGTLLKLREMNEKYGPIEYICLVGSAPALPQFQLPDEEDTAEPDGLVNSDSLFGFLDDDDYTMDAAVGRIINLNVQGASNQIARTLGYDYYVDDVTVETSTGPKTVKWRTHGSVWNGYEVADQRMQMSPGWLMKDDLEDEGFTSEYYWTTGNEGAVWRNQDGKETDFRPAMESSAIVAYRGHGSWHATFYVWKPQENTQPRSKDRLEGHREGTSPSVYDYYLPPQIAVLVACENAKIQGLNWGGDPIVMEELWATNYFYAGAVGLIAATEVSYSNIGQDLRYLEYLINPNDDSPDWDKNNAWYAFTVDGLLNHEDEHGSIGKAHQWAENRYIAYHNNEVSPFDQGTSADWKEVSMYVCYGDPAFIPYQNSPGANEVDPWHNGEDDGKADDSNDGILLNQ